MLPGGPLLGVLEHNSHSDELVADAIGFLEVFSLTRDIASIDKCGDLCLVNISSLALQNILEARTA